MYPHAPRQCRLKGGRNTKHCPSERGYGQATDGLGDSLGQFQSRRCWLIRESCNICHDIYAYLTLAWDSEDLVGLIVVGELPSTMPGLNGCQMGWVSSPVEGA
jgi:hypothetical protein